jgi:hypothetical protein
MARLETEKQAKVRVIFLVFMAGFGEKELQFP